MAAVRIAFVVGHPRARPPAVRTDRSRRCVLVPPDVRRDRRISRHSPAGQPDRLAAAAHRLGPRAGQRPGGGSPERRTRPDRFRDGRRRVGQRVRLEPRIPRDLLAEPHVPRGPAAERNGRSRSAGWRSPAWSSSALAISLNPLVNVSALGESVRRLRPEPGGHRPGGIVLAAGPGDRRAARGDAGPRRRGPRRHAGPGAARDRPRPTSVPLAHRGAGPDRRIDGRLGTRHAHAGHGRVRRGLRPGAPGVRGSARGNRRGRAALPPLRDRPDHLPDALVGDRHAVSWSSSSPGSSSGSRRC